MQINPTALQAIYYGFKTDYMGAFERTAPWSAKVATTISSSTRENRYAFMKMIPRLREWIGERKLNNLAARSYSIINKDWESTIEIDRNDIEDDQLGIYSPAIQQLGAQAKLWPDDMVTTLIQSGTTALGYDGQAFFSGSHPVDFTNVASTTFSNNYTTTPLNAANYAVVRAGMMSVNAEDNKPLKVNPNLIMVPPQLEVTARQIVQSAFLAAAVGANAATGSASNVFMGSAEVLVIPELANQPTVWYLADVSKPIKPFVVQMRKPPQLVALINQTDPNVFFHKSYIYGIDARGNAGFTLPFLIARAIA